MMNRSEFEQESGRLIHAMQTGVALELECGSESGSPKQLRVGVNNALCETAALGALLITKGIITESEYFESIIGMLRDEVRQYEERLLEEYGVKVTLG
jgi:hypothetical protein